MRLHEVHSLIDLTLTAPFTWSLLKYNEFIEKERITRNRSLTRCEVN